MINGQICRDVTVNECRGEYFQCISIDIDLNN